MEVEWFDWDNTYPDDECDWYGMEYPVCTIVVPAKEDDRTIITYGLSCL